MKEILWLGRGGQGAFTAAKLLGAAFADKGGDAYSLAFPSFGPERRGAPVRAFTKLDNRPILDRSETEKADYIVILDETLYTPALQKLLKAEGRILVNTRKQSPDWIAFDGDALAAALHLPVVNTVMLGALSGVSDAVTDEQLVTAIDRYLSPKIREKNKQAVCQAVREVRQ
ncbi:MAG: 2-oxoacid:acceptor oxidoreductase family protein [Oscillospiraceae bacterium]|nr:2-oxoacid:acceptor oxidoreductase family protein [Oscillospiraceae bacterium]